MHPLLAILVVCAAARGEVPRARRILLLPIDDRPTVTQFVRIIGAVADYEVVMPPLALLGRFTRPGDTQKLGTWLRRYRYSGVHALIVSAEMLGFRGPGRIENPRCHHG